MKIKKIYEEVGNPHFNANLLSKKFAKKFFSELDEFYKIVINYNDVIKAFNFIICFNVLYNESITQMEELNLFLGFKKDSWVFETDDFEDGNGIVIYTDFNLSTYIINKLLEKFELEENTKKYNL